MTREEALAGHRRLWNEIAVMIESGVKYGFDYMYKQEALSRIGEKRFLENDCYLCEYVCENEAITNCRRDCLVVWGTPGCSYKNSEYHSFVMAIYDRDYPSAAQMARKIANLPERVVE